MDIEATVTTVKARVLDTLEEQVYQQAVTQDLADTVLRALVESAVGRLQVQMPVATGAVGAVLGLLRPLAGHAQALGLDQQVAALLKRHGVDAAIRQRVIQGLVRYLEANGERLMKVAFDALVAKLTKP